MEDPMNKWDDLGGLPLFLVQHPYKLYVHKAYVKGNPTPRIAGCKVQETLHFRYLKFWVNPLPKLQANNTDPLCHFFCWNWKSHRIRFGKDGCGFGVCVSEALSITGRIQWNPLEQHSRKWHFLIKMKNWCIFGVLVRDEVGSSSRYQAVVSSQFLRKSWNPLMTFILIGKKDLLLGPLLGVHAISIFYRFIWFIRGPSNNCLHSS